ncbi:MAG: biotin/lipoyl-containing protein [Thermoleophilaceae bacterium]
MASDVLMPRLSDSMEEGTVLKWLVEEGGEVRRGEPLVEIETDKANMTYEADSDGVLLEVLAKEGDTLPIGEPIARVGEAGETPSSDGAAAEERSGGEEEPDGEGASSGGGGGTVVRKQPNRPAGNNRAVAEVAPSADDATGAGRIKASPVARRMASELGLALAGIQGTGPGGRILKADVEAAAEPAAGGASRTPAKGGGDLLFANSLLARTPTEEPW